MRINGVDIEERFRVSVMSVIIQPQKIVSYTDWIGNNLVQTRESEFQASQVTVTMIVKSDSTVKGIKEHTSSVLKQISDIVMMCKSGILEFDLKDCSYKAVLESHSSEKLNFKTYRLTLVFQAGPKLGESQTINISPGTTSAVIHNPGNQPAPAVVTITAQTAATEITLSGLAEETITVKNLEEGDVCIIDGENTKVTVGGMNKYGDTDMWEFPRLLPGENQITVKRFGEIVNDCVVEISFRPCNI